MNVLDEGALVLEGVTLAEVVELVVEVLVDLAVVAVLDEEAAEDTEAAHPEDLAGHTGIGGTLPLTEATVATVAAGEVQLAGAGPRVLGDGLADDQAIGDELAHGLAGVGVANLADLVGVEPDLVLAAANDRGGQALLSAEVDPVGAKSAYHTCQASKNDVRGVADAGRGQGGEWLMSLLKRFVDVGIVGVGGG